MKMRSSSQERDRGERNRAGRNAGRAGVERRGSGWISASYVHSFIDEDLANTRATDIESDSFQLNQAVLNLGTKAERRLRWLRQLSCWVKTRIAWSTRPMAKARRQVRRAGSLYFLRFRRLDPQGRSLRHARRLRSRERRCEPAAFSLAAVPAAEPYYHTGISRGVTRRPTRRRCISVSRTARSAVSPTTPTSKRRLKPASRSRCRNRSPLGIYDYYGVENDLGDVNYLDVVASFTATDALTLALNFDQYSDDFGDITGIAGYGTYKFSDQWTATVRVESLEARLRRRPELHGECSDSRRSATRRCRVPLPDGSARRRRRRRHLRRRRSARHVHRHATDDWHQGHLLVRPVMFAVVMSDREAPRVDWTPIRGASREAHSSTAIANITTKIQGHLRACNQRRAKQASGLRGTPPLTIQAESLAGNREPIA